MRVTYEDVTLAAYEALAPFYDRYTQTFGHDRWLANIEAIALSHGLRGRRLLDLGCGTGKSFMPMLDRGYAVTACDVSPAMVERARARAAGTDAVVVVADARSLPVLGCFDLVTCIDDGLNYLLTDEELALAFEGVARNLRPGGLFAFDLNTIGGFRHYFAGDIAVEREETFFWWRPMDDAGSVAAGATLTAVIEVFASDDGNSWSRSSSRHIQRHHPPDLVERLLEEAGFELVDRRGQVTGAQLDPGGDEELHRKFDYFARHLSTAAPGRSWKGVTGHDHPQRLDPWAGGGKEPPPKAPRHEAGSAGAGLALPQNDMLRSTLHQSV
jgi:SAM-dependent methyltransferase